MTAVECNRIQTRGMRHATDRRLQRLKICSVWAVSATAVAPRSTRWVEHTQCNDGSDPSQAAAHTGGRARQARARARTAVRKLRHPRGGAWAISTARLTLRTRHNCEPTNAAVGLTLHAVAYSARMSLPLCCIVAAARNGRHAHEHDATDGVTVEHK